MNDPYIDADPILLPWARRRGLTVDSIYRDDVVRSIWVSTIPNPEPRGQNAQLWITPPDDQHKLEVHVAIGTWHHFTDTTLQGLVEALDNEYAALLDRAANSQKRQREQ